MNELANQYAGGRVVAPERAASGDRVALLRAYIADGNYAQGDRLPPERHLMTELGLTRGSLRKALGVLEREGQIWRRVGKGTFIGRATDDLSEVAETDIDRQVTPLRMARARMSIETSIAREAAINASADAIARIEEAMDAAAKARDWAEYEAQDDRFHRAVAEATDNVLLLAVFDDLNRVRRAIMGRSVTRLSARPDAQHPSFAQHAALARAIAEHDPEGAFVAMRAHLQSVSRRLFEEE